ncbi:filensin [Grus americana]|nr:filensin [Grus americana]XP_054677013.1 filensin [Grus americana]XP_054677014.1 filensin [Grus americana]XP_054677017.1 filensin [Grus americana]XP_054677018.1 filensin [Grus americana]XP_054677019.1 filensin [Grus americana]XP_054677020.1 filensin [Grus americana]XP_054677021.1 filensin [Grus americana]NWH16315.1 BFSP1 protein [Grus americana]
MYRSSFLREVRKEKYERSDAYDELRGSPEFDSLAQARGLENLQELNERFTSYINRARVLEQRNTILRKQLETFQRMDELVGLDEAFAGQIEFNRQRMRELASDRAKLEREEKDAQRMLDEYRNKYRNEREYQQRLKETLERLNKEADEALLCNLELQIESQFLQDDINATKDRYKKNLMEIQTYVSVLQQIIQTTPRVSPITTGICEEKLIAERRIPVLQSQLEEYKSILCQLQTQKYKLQTETTMLEQAIKNTQESYDDEIQLYNEQIENLRKGIEEAERTLEKYTTDCRQLVIYQQSLENELERYKRIIENEDSRLNSAIAGTPVTLFTQIYRPVQPQASRGRDITQAMQDITSVKPRQKALTKKIARKKELMSKDITDGLSPERMYERTLEDFDEDQLEFRHRGSVTCEPEQEGLELDEKETGPEDVPDGARISKAFDKLCNIVREKIRVYKRPEPKPDAYPNGRYVLVTGEEGYEEPCILAPSIPAGGVITVSTSNGKVMNGGDVEPIPELPEPAEPSEKEKVGIRERREEFELQEKQKEEDILEWGKKTRGKIEQITKYVDISETETVPSPGLISPTEPGVLRETEYDREDKQSLLFREAGLPGSMSYEKVEVVESIEKFSDDRIQTYEETAMIVETMIEKTSKKKPGDKGS